MQQNDDTVTALWKQANNTSYGRVVEGGLLHHKDQVNGGSVRQFVLPLERRKKCWRLGMTPCGRVGLVSSRQKQVLRRVCRFY